MNRDNIFLIFLLLTSFYIKACNVDSKGLQTCCCEELIQHDGLLITFDFPLKPSAYNFTTKSDYCHQPGLGVIHPLSVYTPTFFAFDKITEVLSLPILYRQFPKNLNHSIMVNSKYHTFQYSGPDIRYGSYELKNLSVCNFLTIEIDYLRRLGFLKSDIPNDFTFLETTNNTIYSCRFFICLINHKDNPGPFCTESGYYHRKNLLCKAYQEFKDITPKDGCSPLPDCDSLSTTTLVCTDAYYVVTEQQACKIMHMGAIRGYTACTNCNHECKKKKCIDSFKNNQCSFATVCLAETGKSYSNAEEFCDNNPRSSIKDVRLIKESVEGSDMGNLIGQDECCNIATNVLFCDTDNSYTVTDFSGLCKQSDYSDLHYNGTLVEHILTKDDCDAFRDCMLDTSISFPVCEKKRGLFETKLDFCKEFKDGWEDANYFDCSNNSFCTSDYYCEKAVCEEQLTSRNDFRLFCNNHYEIIKTVDAACDFTFQANLEPLFCSNSICSLLECLERRHVEFIPITSPVCHPKTYLLLNDLEAIATAITEDLTLNLDDFLTCDGECDKEACDAIKEENNIDTTLCEAEFDSESGVCAELNTTVSYFASVKEYCFAAIKAGLTANFLMTAGPAFDLDNNALTTDDECIELRAIKDCEMGLNYQSWTKICARDVSVADHSSPTVSKLYPNEARYCEVLIRNFLQ